MVELFAAVALTFTGAVLSPGDWNATISSSAPLNWYRLGETTGDVAIDYGAEGLDGVYGTGVNAPIRGALGAVGGAVAFDGDRKNILLRGSTLTGDWSAEFILKKTGTKVSAELIRGAHLEFPSSHLKLEQYPNTGQVGFTESFAADRVFTPPVIAPLGQFIHLVIVKNNVGTTAYLNGEVSGSSASSVSLSRYQLGDTENESPFAVIDEVVVYNRALSAVEIAQHFRSIPEPSSLATALVGLGILAVRRRR